MWYSEAAFKPRTSPFFNWKNRKLSNQWSLWMYTKHLIGMFSIFWIKIPITFGRSQLSTPHMNFPSISLLWGCYTVYFFKTLKTIDSLTSVPNLLFREFYLNLLCKFKIGPPLSLSCLMPSLLKIMQIIICIFKRTCFENTILLAKLKGKLP